MSRPTIIVEIAFATGAYDGLVAYFDIAKFGVSGFAASSTPPIAPASSLVLDDATRGKLDTGTLASDNANGDWVDVTRFVRSISTRRGRNRWTDRWQAGAATIVLDNRDRRFDPTNPLSPYIIAGETRVEPMRQIRVRALWNDAYFPIFAGYIDSWDIDYNLDANADSTAVVSATDGFKLLYGYEVPSTAYAGTQTSGARIGELLTVANWSATPGDRDIATGNTTITRRTFSGPVLDEILATVTTEIGEFWMSRSGVPTFRNRRYRWENQSGLAEQMLFGDNLSTTIIATTDTTEVLTVTPQASGYQSGDGLVCDGIGYATVPHSAGQGITGDVEIVARLSAVDWTPAATGTVVAKGSAIGNVPYALFISSIGPGRITLVVNDATTTYTYRSATAPPFVDGQTYWVKVTFQRNNGANSVARFFYALDRLDEPGAWNEWGAPQTDATITSLVASTAAIGLGAYNNGTSPYSCTLKRVIIRNGIAGPTVFDTELTPEMPYSDIQLPSTDDLLLNRVSAQYTGGTVQTVENAASISRYLPRAASISGLLHTTDLESQYYAGLLVGLFRKPDVRFESLTVNGQRDDRVWSPLLNREIGDRVAVRRRPPGGGSMIARDCWVEGIAHDIDTNGLWLTRLQLSDATTAPVATTDYAVADTALAGY